LSGLHPDAMSLVEFRRSQASKKLKRDTFDLTLCRLFHRPRPVARRDGIALLHLTRVDVGEVHGVPEGNHTTKRRDDI
jgi:hypothetical protein